MRRKIGDGLFQAELERVRGYYTEIPDINLSDRRWQLTPKMPKRFEGTPFAVFNRVVTGTKCNEIELKMGVIGTQNE